MSFHFQQAVATADVGRLDNAVEKSARNQVVFREVNERIAELTTLVSETDVNLFICECSDTTCAESLEMTAAEYERVRTDGAQFVVVPGHQLPAIEQVVADTGRFLVVETVGAAAAIARDSDPRNHG